MCDGYKVCSACDKNKSILEYSFDGKNIRSQCDECLKMFALARTRTKKGLVGRIYNDQKASSKRRGHKPPAYTVEELRQVFRDSPTANKMFKAWVNSGYKKGLRPSIDRLDDSYGYNLGNIQLMTWDENRAKAYADAKSGRMKKCNSKSVVQLTKQGEFITEHHSQAEASRITGVDSASIRRCCLGSAKTAGKFKWKFKETV